MRKIALLLFVLLLPASMLGYNFTEDVSLTTEVMLTSAYLYHGQYIGGLSFQGEVNTNVYGAFITIWGSVGQENYHSNICQEEVDLHIGYNNYGILAEYKHISLLSYDNLFDYNSYNNQAWLNLGYDFSYFTNANLFIGWYTNILGNDRKINNRLYASYIEIKYWYDFNYYIKLSGAIGIKPWIIHDDKIEYMRPICIEATLSKTFYTNYFDYTILARGMISPHNLTKDNAITHDQHQRINGELAVVVRY